MPNVFRNWEYDDVVDFLDAHGFVLVVTKSGSHEFWKATINNKDFLVDVNRPHGHREYLPKTLGSIVENSGYDKKHWIAYGQLDKKNRKEKVCCKKTTTPQADIV